MKNITAGVVAAVMIFAACANQVAPTGGPADNTPPDVSVSFPEHGQTNVDRGARIVVTFSEWINTGGIARAVALHPRTAQGITVKAARNRIIITPNAPLDSNTTYILTLSAALRDLRNNALPAPQNIVFSTGATLDSGRITGRVVPLDPITAPPVVGLYIDGADWEDARYFAAPDYLTHADSAGIFEFAHLREGRYRVLAFVDRYRIGRVSVGDTAFASLAQIISLTDVAQSQSIKLYPTLTDTLRIVDDIVVDDDVIIDDDDVGDDKIADDENVVNDENIVRDDVDEKIVDDDDVVRDENLVDDDNVVIDDTTAVDDTTAAARPRRVVTSRLTGSAPCLLEIGEDPYRKWMYRPQAGRTASAADTTFFVTRDQNATFAFDSLPPSRGRLIVFTDDNDDDAITFGNLIPWRSPEMFYVVPQPIEIKAGWDVEDLEVDACEK